MCCCICPSIPCGDRRAVLCVLDGASGAAAPATYCVKCSPRVFLSSATHGRHGMSYELQPTGTVAGCLFVSRSWLTCLASANVLETVADGWLKLPPSAGRLLLWRRSGVNGEGSCAIVVLDGRQRGHGVGEPEPLLQPNHSPNAQPPCVAEGAKHPSAALASAPVA